MPIEAPILNKVSIEKLFIMIFSLGDNAVIFYKINYIFKKPWEIKINKVWKLIVAFISPFPYCSTFSLSNTDFIIYTHKLSLSLSPQTVATNRTPSKTYHVRRWKLRRHRSPASIVIFLREVNYWFSLYMYVYYLWL